MEPLLRWRASGLSKKGLTPERLAESLSVEALPESETYQRELVGFRQRRWAERVAVARRFLNKEI